MPDKSLAQIWQVVLGELEVSMSQANFNTWLKNTALLELEEDAAVVGAANIFARDRLEEKYHGDILEALQKQVPQVGVIRYQIRSVSLPADEEIEFIPTAASHNTEIHQIATPSVDPVAQLPVTLASKYNFSNFVVGSGNRLAFAAAQQVTDNPGESYNPLFLYGPPGVGKTHLMWAISGAIAKSVPSTKITYITTEEFLNQFTNAIRKGENFSNRYRDVDVLLVDDLQFIAGKTGTQEAFFHLFNALHQANKQIVLSSDRPPKAIATLEDRLRSRFEWGMVADIQPPDYETRIAILQNKASVKGFQLPDDVASYIAEQFQNNIRELEGALTRLMAHCQAHGLVVDVEIAKQVLGSNSTQPRQTLSPKIVIEKIAAFYDLKITDLTGPKRDKEIVMPRQVAMYIMREELGISFPRIATSLGGRDHTTIMYGVRKINKLLRSNEPVGHEIKTLKQKIVNG